MVYRLSPFSSAEESEGFHVRRASLVWMIRETIARRSRAELIVLVFVYHVYVQGA